MTKFGIPRLALVASAAALVLAACFNGADDQIAAPTAKATSAPKISADGGFGTAGAGLIQVCVPSGTLGGPFTISYGAPTNMVTGNTEDPGDHYTWNDVLVPSTQSVAAGSCTLVFTKNRGIWVTGIGWQSSIMDINIAPTSTGGTFSYICVPLGNQGTFCSGTPTGNPDQSKSGTGPLATLGANPDHGATVTFSYTLPVVTACTLGYPTGTTGRPAVVFNENEVLAAYAFDNATQEVRAWYSDEHALLLGVRHLRLKIPPSPASDYNNDPPIATMSGNPSSSIGAPLINVGLAINGYISDPVDGKGRPLFPVVFVTDITFDPNAKSGDWQQLSGPATSGKRPTKIFGSWKAAYMLVDYTQNPATATVTLDADPSKNHKNVGAGDPFPAGVSDQGYGTEIVWSAESLGLNPAHNYRLQFMVHDGDQNKTGGDVGQACMNIGPDVPDRLVVR